MSTDCHEYLPTFGVDCSSRFSSRARTDKRTRTVTDPADHPNQALALAAGAWLTECVDMGHYMLYMIAVLCRLQRRRLMRSGSDGRSFVPRSLR